MDWRTWSPFQSRKIREIRAQEGERIPAMIDLRIIYKWRGRLVALPAVFVLLSRYGEIEENWIVFAVGAAIFLMGVLIRIWTQQHLHYRLRLPMLLTMAGPYTFVRNPIYIGNTLIAVGLCFLSEMVWFVPFVAAWCVLVYGLAVRYEEAQLREQYGTAYIEYLEHVPRWIPHWHPWHTSRYATATPSTRPYLWPSIIAELHCLLWLVPLISKELLSYPMA